MADGLGVKAKAAWIRDDELEDEWPGATIADPGAGHLLPFVSESITNDKGLAGRGLLAGNVSEEAPEVSSWKPQGDLTCQLRYGTLDRLWGAAMGYENPDAPASAGSPQTLTAGEYRHVYQVHPDLRSRQWNTDDRLASVGSPGDPGHWTAGHYKQSRGGLFIDKGVEAFRLWPAMLGGFTVSCSADDSQVVFPTVGRRLERDTPANYGTSNWTTYGSEVYGEDPGVGICKLADLTCSWGFSGVASWQESNLAITDFNLELNNNLQADLQASGSLYILEPWRNGPVTVTGSFTMARYKTLTLDHHTAMDSHLAMQLQFLFTGASLGTNNAQLGFYMPNVRFNKVSEPVSGPEVLTQTVEFEAYLAGTRVPTSHVTTGGILDGVGLRYTDQCPLYIATVNSYDENVFESQ